MSKTWIGRAAALVIFVATVVASYFYLPAKYAANPLTSLIVLAVFIACVPVIRLRFRKIAKDGRIPFGPQIPSKWRPPLWIGLALIFGAFVWLIGALFLGSGAPWSGQLAFIGFGILVFLGSGLLGIRFTAWLFDFMQTGKM